MFDHLREISIIALFFYSIFSQTRHDAEIADRLITASQNVVDNQIIWVLVHDFF